MKKLLSRRVPSTPELYIKRFWAKVKKTNKCWTWTGYKTKFGYGQFGRYRDIDYSHRIAWRLKNGKISKGMFVLHKCDNPSCVNPKHLFLGSARDNMLDMVKKGRAKHPIETRAFGDKNGKRTHPEKILVGEKHPLSKLNTKKVLEIRKMYKKNPLPYKILASKYKVHKDTVRKIISRINWKHI